MPIGDGGPDDSGSTLVQTGKSALTFTEMAAFVHDIEDRPLARLIFDLDGLMALPEAKYHLVVMVVLKRARAGGAERDAILAGLRRLQSGAEAPAIQKRAESCLAKALG